MSKENCSELKDRCKECFDILERVWRKWMYRDGILNIQISTKITDGVDTGEPVMTFYVVKKLPKSELMKVNIIPKEIEGMKTDVVELSTDDYVLGDTGVSKKDPAVQLRLANGVKCKEE